MIIRLLDLMLSLIALVLLSPIFAVVILMLRLTGEREVFFVQDRVGKNGRNFGLIKFATMMRDSPNMKSGTVTLKDDPRVLPLGKILRKTKINELPQLINVMAGNMSLVGPRPQTDRCFHAFLPEHRNELIKVKPGVSGVGSIVFRNEEKLLDKDSEQAQKIYDTVIMPYKGEIEVWYANNISVANYIKCLLVTIVVLLFPNSNVVWTAFPNCPSPPSRLQGKL